MKTVSIIRDVAIAIAALGVLFFWIFGVNGNPDMAGWSLVIGGISCWVALIAMLIKRIWYRNYII